MGDDGVEAEAQNVALVGIGERLAGFTHLVGCFYHGGSRAGLVEIDEAAKLELPDEGTRFAGGDSGIEMLNGFLEITIVLQHPVAQHRVSVNILRVSRESGAKPLLGGGAEFAFCNMLIEP